MGSSCVAPTLTHPPELFVCVVAVEDTDPPNHLETHRQASRNKAGGTVATTAASTQGVPCTGSADCCTNKMACPPSSHEPSPWSCKHGVRHHAERNTQQSKPGCLPSVQQRARAPSWLRKGNIFAVGQVGTADKVSSRKWPKRGQTLGSRRRTAVAFRQ